MNLFILGFGNDSNYVKCIRNCLKNTQYFFPFEKESNIDEVILNINSKFNLIGFSIGCIIVLDIAKKYRDKINKVILLNIPSYNHVLWSYDIHFLKLAKYIYISCPKFVRMYIYKYCMNPHSPNIVLQNIREYDSFAFNVLFSKLFQENSLKKISDIQQHKQIHLISGYHDEYSFFSNFLQHHFNNVILHKYYGDHHILINDPILFCNKIEKILN